MQRRFSELRRVFEKKAATPPPITMIVEAPISPEPGTVETPEQQVVEVPKRQEEEPQQVEVPGPQVVEGIINDKDQVFLNTLPILTPHVDQAMPTLAVISLNLLADCNLTNSLKNDGDYRYKHARNEAPWSVRLPKLHTLLTRHITQGQVDVFCFQEADYYLFQSDIKPFLLEFGFTSHHQWDDEVIKKKKQPSNPFGVAISYRVQKFKETFRESRSRTMMIGLSHVPPAEVDVVGAKRMSDWFVVNCHLEADSDKNDKRMAQLSSTLFNLSVHGKINPGIAKVVVTGDFNSLATEQPFQWLLGEINVDNMQPHAFRFRDAYEQADDTTRNTATYADPHAREHVDHVAFTADTCEVLRWLAVPLLSENTTKYGIFYDDYPSDHYPVGCLVRALPVAVAVDYAKEEKEDESLTPGQMRVLEFLERGAPKRAKGKPTPTEVAALKAHTASMQAFSSHLNKSQKAWVAKWRKAYKPVEEENARKRTTRSMSLVHSQQKQQVEEMFVGIGELFEENHTQQPAALSILPPKPAASKRRQTLFARAKPMF